MRTTAKSRVFLVMLALAACMAVRPAGAAWLPGPATPFDWTRYDCAWFDDGTGPSAYNRKLYCLGGRTGGSTELPDIWRLDPTTGVWTDTGHDVYEDVSNYSANVLIDASSGTNGPGIYIIGGSNAEVSSSGVTYIQRYYPRTGVSQLVAGDSWPGTNGGGQVTFPGACVSDAGHTKAYCFGGFQSIAAPHNSAQAWVYDPLAAPGSRWTSLPALGEARGYIQGAMAGRKVYAMGGDVYDAGAGDFVPRTTVEVLDLDNLAAGWQILAPMPVASGQGQAFAFGGSLVVAGGGDWSASTAEVMSYDIAANTWDQSFPDLGTRRRNQAAEFIPLETADTTDGLPGLWVLGGRVDSDTPPFGPVELYDLGDIPLGAALDSPALSWDIRASSRWLAQTAVTHDGVDAGRSATITHSGSSSATFQRDFPGPYGGSVGFWWKVSSEMNYDYLTFSIDGVAVEKISGEVGWTWRNYAVTSGVHRFTWTYAKDYTVSSGADRAWLDQVVVTDLDAWQVSVEGNGYQPAAAVGFSPADIHGDASGITDFRRYFTSPTAVQLNAEPGDPVAGPLFDYWTGCDAARAHQCEAAVTGHRVAKAHYGMPVALNAAGGSPWAFTTGGSASWYGVTSDIYSSGPVARTPWLGNGQSSWLETSLYFPEAGRFAALWRVSSEEGFDFLNFSIDGALHSSISGESGWLTLEADVPAGQHTFRFEYVKDVTLSGGLDIAWVYPQPSSGDGYYLALLDAVDSGTDFLLRGGDVATRNLVPQTFDTHDGVDALESNALYGWLSMVVPYRSAGVVRFWMKQDAGCSMSFSGPGSSLNVSGAVDWTEYVLDVPDGGEHTFTWMYHAATEADRFQLDQVVFEERAPWFGEVPAQLLPEGRLLTLPVSATDPNGDALVLSAAGLPPGAAFTDHGNGTGTFSWRPGFGQAGVWVVGLSAGDGTYTGARDLIVKVLDSAGAPVIDPIDDRTVDEGAPLALGVSALDPEGDALSYRVTSGPGAIDAATGFYSWTPDYWSAPAAYDVTVRVSDGTLFAEDTFTVVVNDPADNILFADDFEDGVVTGWTLAKWKEGNGVLTSSARKRATAAVDLFAAAPFESGRIQARVKLTSSFVTSANAMLQFARSADGASYRYVQLAPGRVVIGQTGFGTTAVRKRFTAPAIRIGKARVIDVLIKEDGTVEVWNGARRLASHLFGGVLPGGLALRTNKAKAVVDNVRVTDNPAFVTVEQGGDLP